MHCRCVGVVVVSWSIDPFGHSRGQAYIHEMIGFDATVINRIPDLVKQDYRYAPYLRFVSVPLRCSPDPCVTDCLNN
jgi:hypothetical protein